jgi:transcriptional regulator
LFATHLPLVLDRAAGPMATDEAIVRVDLQIDRLEGKWKMSQNRSDADITGVIRGLELLGLRLASHFTRV